ncbi:MAG: hypothetical protein JRJ19_01100, partial [Deltaproteobacteria bacterium]|nr:hypothetical protein [Deltaproteobacteria bacterium]
RPRGRFRLRAEAEIKGEKAYGSVPMEAYRRTGSFESRNLFVYTDRGVYRPGETVLVRTIAWNLRGEFKPIRQAKIETLLKGPDGRVVTGASMKTDSFGVAASRLHVPEDAPEGPYQLVVRHGGAQESARLRVKRFKTPAIRIKHDLPRFIAPATADLAVTVKLGYFTGGAPQQGSFEARVKYDSQELFKFSAKIFKDQPVKFKIPLEPVRKVVPDGMRFQVELKATDQFSRSDSVTRDILYSKRPYLAVPDLDKDVYVEGEEVNLTVRLTDPDGIPVRGKQLSLTGDGDKIKLASKTDPSGVVLFKFKMPNHSIQVSVSIADVPNPLFTRTVNFMAKKPMLSNLPKPVVKERRRVPIVITFDKDFIPIERVVHGDVIDYSGAITGGFKIVIRKRRGKYVARGSFLAPSWGSMLITLYTAGIRREDRKRGRRLSTVGLLTEGMSLTAHPDKELSIKLDGVPDQARPRSSLKARFKVKTPRGKAVNSILGVMLVDRSVLSLMDPLEKTPMDRFYNPVLKVLSTTGSDILTWPVVTRNWGDSLYDIALPPFGFMEGAPYYDRGPRRGLAGGGQTAGLMKPTAKIKKKSPTIDGFGFDEDSAKSPPPSNMPMSKAQKAKPVMVMKEKREIRGRRGDSPKIEKLPRIIIRTDLPATTLWKPALLARGGRAVLEFSLPEALTEQELIVMASDKAGGIGLLRKVIKVTQPLMVRSDLPRSMVAGDKIKVGVQVQNTTRKDQVVEVSLASAGLKISPASRKIKVPASGAEVAFFTIKADNPGLLAYTVEARAGKESDAERRELDVRPRGQGELEELVAQLTRNKPFETNIVKTGNEFIEAHLEVAFPTIIPALQEIDNLLDKSAWWANSILATPQAACALEVYLAKYMPNHPTRNKIRTYLKGVAGWLSNHANPDGGFSWWRTGRPTNLFASAHALRLMGALLRADIAVAPNAVMQTVSYLKKTLGKDGLWPVNDIAFWEGSTEKVRLQVSASIFRSLAEVLAFIKAKPEKAWISEVAGRFEKYLESPDDPLTAAEAAMGIYAFKRATAKYNKKARRQLKQAAGRLVKLRRQAHWEPSWFHAYGGTIEATVASLELLAVLDRRGFEDELREGLLYLLSTRNEWGMWHCPFGTASAIRAFTFLPPPRKEIASVVSVYLGKKEIERVKINPRDPFLSAVRLRHLALGSKLQTGPNSLKVRYNGKLEAPVRLIIRRWKSKAKPIASSDRVKITRSLKSSTIDQGDLVEVTLKISASKLKDDLRISVPTPGNTEIDPESLTALKKSKGVLSARALPDRLEVILAGPVERVISYRLLGRRSGVALFSPATASSAFRPGLSSSTEVASLTVR